MCDFDGRVRQVTGKRPGGMVRTRVTAAVAAAVSPGRRRGGGTEVRQELGSPGGPTEELGAQVSRALVATDDAVQTSEQELGFATARFGAATAAPFSAALESARGELAAAFSLHQQLDDGSAADDATRQSYLADISARCAAASRPSICREALTLAACWAM